jgi:nucleolar MIF4G domain-containing protein 1
MESLVPLYASLVAALHVSVHHDIGSYLLEAFTVKLMEVLSLSSLSPSPPHISQGLKGDTAASASSDHALISDKTSTNMMLFLVYLYNLRVVHHRLTMEILEHLVTPTGAASPLSVLSPLRVELILCVIEHCGPTLRTDDPQGLKSFIIKLNGLSALYSAADTAPKNASFDGRLHFLVACISDLKNNKSRRSQSVHSEAVMAMKKWIGRVKASRVDKAGDGCLTMSLQDLLQAESVGRWWRAGASWGGRDLSSQQQADQKKSRSAQSQERSAGQSEEEQVLLKLANKFRMNTSVKRDIFVVVMSSRDAADAYERLCRLDLKGKQDREIVRVIATVCGLESTYNEFYSQLLTLLCEQNRQNRTTLQYVFWDLFKALVNDTPSSPSEVKQLDRKAINMARLLANMVTQFYLSLSLLKVIEMSALTSPMMLFLATFFLALFSTKVTLPLPPSPSLSPSLPSHIYLARSPMQPSPVFWIESQQLQTVS